MLITEWFISRLNYIKRKSCILLLKILLIVGSTIPLWKIRSEENFPVIDNIKRFLSISQKHYQLFLLNYFSRSYIIHWLIIRGNGCYKRKIVGIQATNMGIFASSGIGILNEYVSGFKNKVSTNIRPNCQSILKKKKKI